MRIIATLFIGLVFFQTSFSQKLSSTEVQNDLNYLTESIIRYDPALQVYNPLFNQKADSLKAIVKDSLNLFEHFALVSKITALANEGHFGLGNWQDTIHKGFLNNSFLYLPLQFKIINNHLFVWENLSSESQLKKGDEILTINGKSVPFLLKELYKTIPTDGEIESYPQRALESAFNWMYYLYIETSSKFYITYVSHKANQESLVNIPAISLEQMRVNYKNKNQDITPIPAVTGKDKFYEFKLEKNTAVLTLKSFNRQLTEEHKVKPKKLYKEIFKTLKENEINTLIIDLRNNFGGLSKFADEMVPYILKEKKKGVFKSSVSWKGKEKNYTFPSKSKLAFQGKIYVLVNGNTYSTASVLARHLKEHAHAYFIGEETGTRYEGFAAGSEQIVYLPHSNFRIAIPRYLKQFPESSLQPTKNRGLLPDYLILQSIDYLMNEEDEALMLAHKMAAGSISTQKK